MNIKALVHILRNIAALLEIEGENPFKTRAYTNAADIISHGDIDLISHIQKKTLGEVRGFGKALVSKITEFYETGRLVFYENLISRIPESILELTYIPGLGPRKIKLLMDELGITNLDKLEEACNNGMITGIKGFTEKTAEDILTSIDFIRAFKGRSLQQNISEIAGNFLEEIEKCRYVERAGIAGDLRRLSETIGDIIIVASTGTIEELQVYLASVADSVTFHDNLCEVDYKGTKIKVVITNPGDFVTNLHNFTGSEEYVARFGSILEKAGYNVTGNTNSKNNNKVIFNEETELYSLAGLPYIRPVLREKGNIIERALSAGLPRLIEPEDLKGIVHTHTTWSDGKHTVREMALQAKELGFEYIVITDHSKSSVVANGLKEDRVRQQHEEIDRLNSEGLGIDIFKGIECDILSDGSLDYPEEVLRSFEVVIASVHNNFKMKKEDMTRRIIKAVSNPYTTMLGHPTGRLLLARQAYETDIKQIIDAAADYGKIIEINSNPYRLDLNWENAGYAAEKGVKLSINPDSHRKETLTDVYYGITVAQKALLGSSDVVNCLASGDFRKIVCNK